MRYNTKINENQDTEFCCPTCLTEELIDALQMTRDYECIELIACADVITELMRVLLNIVVNDNVFTLGMVNIDGNGYDYNMEYTLTINDDYSIWVEPTFREIDGDLKLYNSEAYITYLCGDCNSKILKKLEDDGRNVMIFDFECDDE